ncbi:putative ribonuclease H-like domain-containing protein [Tanacetum coccineum]
MQEELLQFQNCLFAFFLSQMEPKKVIQALKDPSWIEAMQEELLQFQLQKDERGIVVRNKERLVVQGYTQEEGIDYHEVFALVARIEAIKLFLAYASFMGFIVYPIDVKSAFLYGTIEEEVYVCQPPGFEDPQFPNKVYKVEKALYGLHQAPKAWYETLSTYLLENGYKRGTIDKTLFIKKDKGDILLVLMYVDDIIFGSIKKFLCVEFEQMMHKRFQMSSMRELTFFLGLQVQPKEDGIFISQDKYVADILKKFDFVTVKISSTPMEPNKALVKDEKADNVDVHLYRSMIGSLMYLTTFRHHITFAVYACARFQVTPKVSHLHAVKSIFRYLKGQPKLGLWYPRDSPVDLEAFSDSDYAGASLDRKSTTGGCQFLGKRLISWQCKKQTIVANSTTEAAYVAAANCCGQDRQSSMVGFGKIRQLEGLRYALTKNPTIYVSLIEKFWQTGTVRTVDNGEQEINATVDGKEFTITEASVRRHLQLADADDEAVHQEMGDSVERAATTATSLEVVQDSSNIAKTQSMETPTEPISQETGSDGGPRRQETMGVSLFKLGLRGNLNCPMIHHSEEGRMIEEINQDVGVTLVTPTKVSSQEDQPEDQLGVLSVAKVLADAARVHTYSRRRRAVSTGSGGVSTASRIVSTAGMIQQVNVIIPSSSVTKDKGKAIMTESKPEQTTTKLKQRQEKAGYEVAIRLQEQLNEEESQRIARDAEVAQWLQEEFDAAEKQKMTQVHQAAQGFTKDKREDIRARVEADEELT